MSAISERLTTALADRYRLEWLERGYRAGWKEARFLSLDPFFASVRGEPRYLSLTAAMTQDVAEMRKRAAAAHPALFSPPSPSGP